jgi:hypothetical protein
MFLNLLRDFFRTAVQPAKPQLQQDPFSDGWRRSDLPEPGARVIRFRMADVSTPRRVSTRAEATGAEFRGGGR